MIEISIAKYIKAWHLMYYVPRKNDKTQWSRRILEMKAGNSPLFEECIAKNMANILKKNSLKIDYIIRALGSEETIPTENKALNRIGVLLANEINAKFTPSVLSKVRKTDPMHKIPDLPSRQQNIQNTYLASSKENMDFKTILVIDDVITTSCTAVEIARALSEAHPDSNLVFFAVAKTNDDSDCNSQFT